MVSFKTDETTRAVLAAMKRVGKWFVAANSEAFDLSRITTRDCADFRDSLRRERSQSVATVNRNLVSLRRFFGWLKDKGHVQSSPLEWFQVTCDASARRKISSR